jgi:hypothetical protein
MTYDLGLFAVATAGRNPRTLLCAHAHFPGVKPYSAHACLSPQCNLACPARYRGCLDLTPLQPHQRQKEEPSPPRTVCSCKRTRLGGWPAQARDWWR